MSKKIFVLLIILSISLPPFIFLFSFNEEIIINDDYFLFAYFLNSFDLKGNFGSIEKNKANFTRNGLEVNQTLQSYKIQTNWVVQNDGGLSPNTTVGDISRDFNITGIDGYNRTKYLITIQNVSTKSTWRDVEENTSSTYLEMDDSLTGTNMTAMEFNITSRSRV